MDRTIEAISRRLNAAVWLNRAVPWTAALLGVAATLMVALKLIAPGAEWQAAWLLSLIPLVLLAAWLVCLRRNLFFRRAHIVELIDHWYRDDGSVTAYDEAPDRLGATPAEAARIHEVAAAYVAQRPPRIQWRRHAMRLAPAALYAVAAVAIPTREIQIATPQSEVAQALTEPLAEKLEEHREVLPEREFERLEEEVLKLRKSPRGVSREQWEAIEELDRRVDEATERSRNRMTELARRLTELAESGRQAAARPEAARNSLEAQRTRETIERLQELTQAIEGQVSEEVLERVNNMLERMAQTGGNPNADIVVALDALRIELATKPGGT